jgi:hypothetical protein
MADPRIKLVDERVDAIYAVTAEFLSLPTISKAN